MGALMVLTGTLMLMMSAIWIIGEALKKDLLKGALALLTFPVFSVYYTFFEDYARGHQPFFIGLAGTTLLIAGYVIGW
jgi:hypothetical protein